MFFNANFCGVQRKRTVCQFYNAGNLLTTLLTGAVGFNKCVPIYYVQRPRQLEKYNRGWKTVEPKVCRRGIGTCVSASFVLPDIVVGRLLSPSHFSYRRYSSWKVGDRDIK